MKLHDAWFNLLAQLLHEGKEHAPRGQRTREIIGHSIAVDDLSGNVLDVPGRKLNFRFMVAEWLPIAYGRNDLQALTRYNPNMSQFSDDSVTLSGAYGPRLRTGGQLDYVVDAIVKDNSTRQAVALIWSLSPRASKDVPCTLTLQFLLRDGKLNLVATMRSSDAWLGVPYDAFTFCQIANAVAGELAFRGVPAEPGSFKLNMASSHLYEQHWGPAEALLDARRLMSPHVDCTIASPFLPGRPPAHLEAYLVNPTSAVNWSIASPWYEYHRALLSPTSRDAREWLMIADNPGYRVL